MLRSIDRFNTFEVDQSVFKLRKRRRKRKKKPLEKFSIKLRLCFNHSFERIRNEIEMLSFFFFSSLIKDIDAFNKCNVQYTQQRHSIDLSIEKFCAIRISWIFRGEREDGNNATWKPCVHGSLSITTHTQLSSHVSVCECVHKITTNYCSKNY